MLEIRDLYVELDRMTDIEVARAIIQAGGYESQFFALTYLLQRPSRRDEIRRILDKDNVLNGALLE
ncbi:MAG TPA: hypothetical protein VJH92_01280 [Candidatus Nanoarchaeia archaeon]|nr:hypothetical protein [Candidatus Nanoarchaeia archaeon]